MKHKRYLAASALLTATLLTTTTLANAVEYKVPNDNHGEVGNSIRACPEKGQIYVSATVINSHYHIGVGQIFRAGPGGEIKASTTSSYSVNASTNISGSISIGEIISATVSAGYSSATTSSRKQSWGYSHPIPAGRFGNMQFGNFGLQVRVIKQQVVYPCNLKTIASGTAIIPTDSWGYIYWE